MCKCHVFPNIFILKNPSVLFLQEISFFHGQANLLNYLHLHIFNVKKKPLRLSARNKLHIG